LLLLVAVPAQAAPESLQPGDSLGIEGAGTGASCTANFLLSDGKALYLATAGHCHGSTDGGDDCHATYPALKGVRAMRNGAELGPVVYQSFLAMQAAHEPDATACGFNDLLVIKLNGEAAKRAKPSVRGWGGPSGLESREVAVGDVVDAYSGNSARQGVDAQRSGVVHNALDGSAWKFDASLTCIPGDSGSPVLLHGKALGVLNRGAGAVCQVSYLDTMLDYAATHGAPRLRLVTA
jgi:V8-like Glu-specific endopeptidase